MHVKLVLRIEHDRQQLQQGLIVALHVQRGQAQKFAARLEDAHVDVVLPRHDGFIREYVDERGRQLILIESNARFAVSIYPRDR